MPKVVITGCSGYIGSTLCGHLLDEMYHVVAFDNQMYGTTSLLSYLRNPRFSFVRGDVRDSEHVAEVIKDANVIIPLAALVGAPLCEKNKVDARLINFEAVKYIALKKHDKQLIILPNSNSGYGFSTSDQPLTEEDPMTPVSLYGETKMQAEMAVRSVENHIVLRLATIFGASLRPRNDLLVNNLVLRAMKDRAVVLYEGQYMRNYLHVNDICRAIVHLIEKRGTENNVYNVGNDELNMSKKMLCEQIKKHIPLEIIQAEYTQDPDKRNYVVSSQKLYKTGFRCEWSLDDGIQELIKMYKMIDTPQFANY